MARGFFVYIMTNGPRRHVLYIGVTGDIVRRVFQHKHKLIPGFSSRYNLTRLVYFETFVYPDAAIAREKELKGWLRRRKIELIASLNPHGTTWPRAGTSSTDQQQTKISPREILRSA
jgi:putative endonuclease